MFFCLIIMAKKSKVVFKTYAPNQAILLTPSLDELTAQDHPVRVVADVIDKINTNSLYFKNMKEVALQAII